MTTELTYTIKWILTDEGKYLVKFAELEDDAVEYADFVLPYAKKVAKGDTVSVKIDPETKKIVSIRKVEAQKKTEEKPTEEVAPPSPATSDAEYRTVEVMTGNKEVILFVEDKDAKNWTLVPEAVGKEINSNTIRGKKVKVVLETVEKNGKQRQSLVALEVLEDAPEATEHTTTDATPSYSGNGKDDFYKIKKLENRIEYLERVQQASIESQASVNSANRVVANLVDKDMKPEEITKRIKKIAEANYTLIQELKND